MKTSISKDQNVEYIELVEAPLYHKFIFEPEYLSSPSSFNSVPSWRNHKSISDKLNDPNSKFKSFCLHCNEDRIFNIIDKYIHTENWKKSNVDAFNMFDEGIRYHEFECSWDPQHRFQLVYKVGKDYVMKIGQYPSAADLENVQKEYQSILGKEKFFEFKRANGLMAFGVGIGSFVYLRRIIEYLIQEAHKKAKIDVSWNEEKYRKGKIKEKIKQLEDYLPEFFISNKAIYGILSKGIHELSERDCTLFFPVLKNSIELILNEQIEEQKRNDKMKELSKSINEIDNKIRNRDY